ncbi:MAG: hypothetical protein ABL932_10470 [Terricaulis sp.]
MTKFTHSEVAAKLAIEGAVAAIGGTVQGTLGLTPRMLSPKEKEELGWLDIGDTLYYPVNDSGVFFHTDGAYTTIWFIGGDFDKGAATLDKLILRKYPDAKRVKDEPHAEQPGYNLRTYDIRLPSSHLAIVDTIYVAGRTSEKKFMIRITAMARQN